MIRKFLKVAVGIAIGLLAALTLLVMFYTENPYSQDEIDSYSQEEIDWCAANRPSLTLEVVRRSLATKVKLVCTGLSGRRDNESIRVAQRTS